MSDARGLDEPVILQQPASEIHDPLAPNHLNPVERSSAASDANGHIDTSSATTTTGVAVFDNTGAGDLLGTEAKSDVLANETAESDDPALVELVALEEEWEEEDDDTDESAYEVALEGLSDQVLRAGNIPDACSYAEALQYRQQLRRLGKERFVDETLFAGRITAKRLCTAFGILPPTVFDGTDDENYYGLLNLGLERELHRRQKLPQYNSIEDAISLIEKSRNIIVITGAGISTSLGIPDFRSAGTGFYDRLEANGLTDRISEPSEVFDLSIFQTDPDIFYSVAGDILPPEDSSGKLKFTPTHAFIKLLEDKGRLLTNYTQNIDNIESYAGISRDKIIQCHGSFATATCQKCRNQIPGESIFPQLRAKEIAYCKKCESGLNEGSTIPDTRKRKRSPKSNSSTNKKPKRDLDNSSDDDEDDNDDLSEPGIMKPDITFFGEDLPATFHSRIATDQHTVDLVLVIGTSLKVDPVASIPSVLDPSVPQIYISKSRCSHIDFDIEVNGDCDVVVAELARRLGWSELEEHEMVTGRPAHIETGEGDGFLHRHLVQEGGSTSEDVKRV